MLSDIHSIRVNILYITYIYTFIYITLTPKIIEKNIEIGNIQSWYFFSIRINPFTF